MNQVKLYIAASLDGYIARPDGNLDWLNTIPAPDTGDYGYADLLNSIGTTIMGRKTYEEVIGFGVEWPYGDLHSYVVTSDPGFQVSTPNTFVQNGDLNAFIRKLKDRSDKDIWLIGGGRLITHFLNHGLIDRMILTLVPIILGDGIPLFPDRPKESNWTLAEVKSYNTGLVNLTYDKR